MNNDPILDAITTVFAILIVVAIPVCAYLVYKWNR